MKITIGITIPVMVEDLISGESAVICEFDGAVEIEVTNFGMPAQTYGPPENCYPAEGPEWEEVAFYIDLNGQYHPCPEKLLPLMEDYATDRSDTYIDLVCVAIADEHHR